MDWMPPNLGNELATVGKDRVSAAIYTLKSQNHHSVEKKEIDLDQQ